MECCKKRSGDRSGMYSVGGVDAIRVKNVDVESCRFEMSER
jgi:hypothetical protein